MWRSKLLRSRAARTTLRPVFAASADAPASTSPALPPSENLRATSAAVAELVEGLDFVFDQVNYDEEPGDLLQLHLERLMDEASKYRNSSVGDDVGEQWTCSSEAAQLLLAACQCSSLVYDPMSRPGPDLRPVMSRAPSATGTEKALSIWKMDATKTLIVSVRGTASVADHMVNMNADPKRTTSMFELPSSPTPVLAHGGFLTCARVLLPLLLDEMSRQADLDTNLSEVVLTGHSAGGAVSSLMFLHLICRAPARFASLKLSLVTFGSAPVLSTNVMEAAAKHPNVGHVLAFVNEYDIVPRADRSYVRSIVDLYRSRYGLPSVAAPPGVADGSGHRPSEPTVTEHVVLDRQHATPQASWTLPEPVYHVVGDIVVLQSRLSSQTLTSDTVSDTRTLSTPQVKAVKVSHREFGNLLFCDLGVHKRRTYLQRVEMISARNVWDGRTSVSVADTLHTETHSISDKDMLPSA